MKEQPTTDGIPGVNLFRPDPLQDLDESVAWIVIRIGDDVRTESFTIEERGQLAVDINGLGLKTGKWVVANCGKFPSEKNCQLVIMAPQSQRGDLLEAASSHAVASHGHEDTPGLRKELDQFLEVIDI